MASPMHSAYCTTPMSDAYCTMPPTVAHIAPAAAHTPVSTAGLGDMDMAGVTIVLAFAAYAIRWRVRRRA